MNCGWHHTSYLCVGRTASSRPHTATTLRYCLPPAPAPATMTTMGNYLLGSQFLQAILPTIVKDNIEVASFFALLTYVLFLVNWLVSTDWLEKVSAIVVALSLCSPCLVILDSRLSIFLLTYIFDTPHYSSIYSREQLAQSGVSMISQNCRTCRVSHIDTPSLSTPLHITVLYLHYSEVAFLARYEGKREIQFLNVSFFCTLHLFTPNDDSTQPGCAFLLQFNLSQCGYCSCIITIHHGGTITNKFAKN